MATKIDKRKAWCCTTAGGGRQTQAQCAWVLKKRLHASSIIFNRSCYIMSVGGSSAEVARLNRTKQTNSFAHKLSWGALWNNSATRFCLAPPFARPLYCGHKRSPCGDRLYMYSALTEKILTTEIDKQKVWCCTTAGGGRRKGGEPPRKEAVRVRKSPYFYGWKSPYNFLQWSFF